MKFAVVVLAVVAAASAQTFPRYTPGQYNPGQYNPGQYNQYNRYQSRFSTPVPFRYSTTPAPVVSYAPTTFAPAFSPTPAPLPAVVPNYKAYNGDARLANIVRYDNTVNPDGTYSYAYETDNGIAAQETGSLTAPSSPENGPAVAAQGSFAYTSPEGVPVAISYIANENGFQPQGDVLPTPPPIPELILRSLEYLGRNAPQVQK